jgi:hypothetical protein
MNLRTANQESLEWPPISYSRRPLTQILSGAQLIGR